MLKRTKRAPRACTQCIRLKVRCDASIRGCPCTRCWQDGRRICVLRDKTVRRSKRASNQTEPTASKEPDHAMRPDNSLDDIAARPNGLNNPNGCVSNACTDPSQAPDHPGKSNCLQEHTSEASESHESGNLHFLSYPFLHLRRLSFLPPEDLAFLTSKNCLAVPDGSAVEEFVTQYFLHMHPCIPVLDEAQFWRTYNQSAEPSGEAPRKISLFVFQALLFASCPFVSLETIRRCGYGDKRMARNILYGRAKVLFDLNAEDRPLARAQGAILLTHHTTADDPQAGSVWLTHAIQNAMLVGRRPVAVWEEVEEFLIKRLWWSALLRGRVLCLGLRRRPQVTQIEFDASSNWLEEADFEDEIRNSQVYEPGPKRLLFAILQEQCQLAVLLTDMVCLIFSSWGLSSPSLSLEEFKASIARVKLIKHALVQWKTNSQLPSLVTRPETPDSALLLTKLTYMYHCTAQIDVAHYEALLVQSHPIFAGKAFLQILWETGKSLEEAMDGLTDVMEYLSKSGYSRTLPLVVLAYLAMPLINSAIDFKLSPSHSEMIVRRQRLETLGEIVRHSRNLYDVTDFVSVGTNHILQLVYMTSENIFLRGGKGAKAQSCFDNISSRRPSMDGSANAIVPSGHIQKERPTTWHDAFLQYPLAYLRISTSVDYSLAVGRLPEDCSLPQPVRQIPRNGLWVELPWMVHMGGQGNGRQIARERHEWPPSNAVTAHARYCPSTFNTAEGIDGLGPKERVINIGEQNNNEVSDILLTVLEDVENNGNKPESPSMAQPVAPTATCQGRQPPINLDFLQLEPTPPISESTDLQPSTEITEESQGESTTATNLEALLESGQFEASNQYVNPSIYPEDSFDASETSYSNLFEPFLAELFPAEI